jgi:tRNA threonylcarbamoyladenosine biosynthesis protein TsaE
VSGLYAATADDTRALGARLAQALLAAPRDRSYLVALSGELGAGKTTLVSGLLSALGHVGPTRSPTYTLIEPYRLAGWDVHHCDLYRLRHPDELEDLGLRDLAVPGSLLLVEWPERAEGRLGTPDIELALTYDGDGRACEVRAQTAAGQRLAAQLSAST